MGRRSPVVEPEAAGISIRNMPSPNREELRKQKWHDIFQNELEVSEKVKERFLYFLKELHELFCLDESERGETCLVQLELILEVQLTGESGPGGCTSQSERKSLGSLDLREGEREREILEKRSLRMRMIVTVVLSVFRKEVTRGSS